jgi:hypothetical protein
MNEFRGGNERLRAKLNRLRTICDRLEVVRGDPFITVLQNPKGTTIGLNVPNLLKRIPKVGEGGAGGIGVLVAVACDGGNNGDYNAEPTLTYSIWLWGADIEVDTPLATDVPVPYRALEHAYCEEAPDGSPAWAILIDEGESDDPHWEIWMCRDEKFLTTGCYVEAE